jgi:hypothetical protein
VIIRRGEAKSRKPIIFRGYLLATFAGKPVLTLSRKGREKNEDLRRLGKVLYNPTFLKVKNKTERRRLGLEEGSFPDGSHDWIFRMSHRTF